MDTVVIGGDPNATVEGLIIQELDQNQNLLFQWRSWDHFHVFWYVFRCFFTCFEVFFSCVDVFFMCFYMFLPVLHVF